MAGGWEEIVVAGSWVGCQPRVETAQREQTEIRATKIMCSKLSAVVATANFQQKK
jgi:hypothetical protein